MNRIILLDIDGVLVEPGGYRAALRATVQRFMGEFEIKEDLLTNLEKHGISSEWDMSPLIIAAHWDFVLAQHPVPNLPDDVSAASQVIQSMGVVPGYLSIPDFELVIGQYPAEAAFYAGVFQNIPATLQRNLLTNTRKVYESQIMRTFQHFTLGSKRFEETYQLPAEFEAESLLQAADKPNINAQIIERLRQPQYHLAAFTARPSHPPPKASAPSLGYAPEAELALELVKLTDMPLMAFGKLEYIAVQHGLNPAALLKPSPFQALAGALVACTGDEIYALQAAYDWYMTGELNGEFGILPKSFEFIVVEDTMGGIHSVRAAGEILRQAGFDVAVRAFGLTGGVSAKAAAFDAADVPYFEEWDSLIKGMPL
jgi:hypothetical protein